MHRFILPLLFTLTAALLQAQIAPRIQRSQTAGIDLLVLPTNVRDVVTLRGSLPAGDAAAKQGNVAVATLVGEMLDQGTKRRDKFAIAEQLEAVGATISFAVTNDVLQISAKCLSKDMPLVVAIIAEQLREPRFDPEEFTKLKSRLAGAFQRQLESTDARAMEAFNQRAFPAEHPNYTPPVSAFLKALETAKLEDVQAFHARHYGPQGMVLVLVGDVAPEEAQSAVAAGFTGWSGGSPVVRAEFPATVERDQPRTETVRMEDKTSVSVVWGQPTGLRYSDPNALALRVGTAILGSGFTGRLLANVRDKEGLTYGISAAMANDTFNDGEWRIVATFAPDLLEQGIASTQRQLTSWYREGVTARELDERKTNLAGSFKVQLATTDGLASTILQTVQRGLELAWIDQYPQKVQALQLDEVNQAIRRQLNPEQMVLIRAGTVPGND